MELIKCFFFFQLRYIKVHKSARKNRNNIWLSTAKYSCAVTTHFAVSTDKCVVILNSFRRELLLCYRWS